MANRYDFTITPRDVDFSRRATLVSLCDYILESAGKDADALGFGLRNLIREHAAWVLSRMAVEIRRYPDQYECFYIETWVESVEKLHTVRNFIVRDAEDRVLAEACTYWSVIDIRDRRVKDLTGFPKYLECVTGEALSVKPVRVRPVRPEPAGMHRVAYTDIDFNGHANTTRYIGWMLDTLPLEEFKEKTIDRLDINFMRESMFGAVVNIACERKEETLVFSLTRENTALCNAMIRLKPNL